MRLQGALLPVVEQDGSLDDAVARESLAGKPLKVSVPHRLLQTASRSPGGIDIEQRPGGSVETEDIPGRVNRNHALHHRREDRVPFAVLAGDGLDAIVELPRHVVHGLGQNAELVGVVHRELRVEIPARNVTPAKSDPSNSSE